MASNLVNTTRIYVEKGWKSAITYAMPLFTKLVERELVFPGGLQYERINEVADQESLVQEHGPNDPLVGGSKEILAKPRWNRAFLQIPIERDVDDEVMNAPEGDGQLVRIAKIIAKSALRSLKQVMNKRAYGCATDTEIDTYHTLMQGIPSALNENATYGHLTRTGTTVNAWFQAADHAAEDTAVAINKSSVWNWIDAIKEYSEGPDDIMIIMGKTLYNRLKAQFEASNSYVPKGNASKQGFESMSLDGYEIVKDLSLERLRGSTLYLHDGTSAGLLDGTSADYGYTYVFVININTWSLRYSDRAGSPFEMSDFFSQDKVINGVEKSLARLKWKGNLVCEQPNANLMRTAVT